MTRDPYEGTVSDALNDMNATAPSVLWYFRRKGMMMEKNSSMRRFRSVQIMAEFKKAYKRTLMANHSDKGGGATPPRNCTEPCRQSP